MQLPHEQQSNRSIDQKRECADRKELRKLTHNRAVKQSRRSHCCFVGGRHKSTIQHGHDKSLNYTVYFRARKLRPIHFLKPDSINSGPIGSQDVGHDLVPNHHRLLGTNSCLLQSFLVHFGRRLELTVLRRNANLGRQPSQSLRVPCVTQNSKLESTGLRRRHPIQNLR